MFDFTETIQIEALPEDVWIVLQDIETWWPASNPEHISLERLDDKGVEVGARLRIREKIAGIPGEAIGEITRVDSARAVTWEAPQARYKWHGVPLTVGEGVTWGIETGANGTGTQLSAHVWATFPQTPLGRVVEWFFTRVLNGIDKDREHARTELRYLKETIEAS